MSMARCRAHAFLDAARTAKASTRSTSRRQKNVWSTAVREGRKAKTRHHGVERRHEDHRNRSTRHGSSAQERRGAVDHKRNNETWQVPCGMRVLLSSSRVKYFPNKPCALSIASQRSKRASFGSIGSRTVVSIVFKSDGGYFCRFTVRA
ncbi:unnamed protein product [Hapterophycus canaliculatus]